MTMVTMDIERARMNMVEQQIRPWDVLDSEVLEVFSRMHREQFAPPAFKSLAFSDLEVPLTLGEERTGEVMLSPKLEARMLQAAAVHRNDQALEIGTGSGFMAALLAQHARHVRTVERLPLLAQFAKANLQRAGISNVNVETRDGADPAQLGEGRWDVIVFSGSVAQLDPAWLERLSVGGRLVAVVGEAPVMHLRRVTRRNEKAFEHEDLVETGAPPLVGFARPSRFRF
jgi:protein-L-isoaspartate(D-aspartate) O-methyltransferase